MRRIEILSALAGAVLVGACSSTTVHVPSPAGDATEDGGGVGSDVVTDGGTAADAPTGSACTAPGGNCRGSSNACCNGSTCVFDTKDPRRPCAPRRA
jgi:hypothetical protein